VGSPITHLLWYVLAMTRN